MNANKPAESKCWNSGSDSSQTLKDLLLILERITAAGAGFRSLTESIDTTVPAGRMMMQMLGAFAEYEREMVKERTQAGLKAARAQGRHGGRRPKFTQAQRAEILSMLTAGRPAAEVARLFQVHRATISRLNAASRQAQNPLWTIFVLEMTCLLRRIAGISG